MNINSSYHRGLFDFNNSHVIKSRNDLKLDSIEYIEDNSRKQLVIFL